MRSFAAAPRSPSLGDARQGGAGGPRCRAHARLRCSDAQTELEPPAPRVRLRAIPGRAQSALRGPPRGEVVSISTASSKGAARRSRQSSRRRRSPRRPAPPHPNPSISQARWCRADSSGCSPLNLRPGKCNSWSAGGPPSPSRGLTVRPSRPSRYRLQHSPSRHNQPASSRSRRKRRSRLDCDNLSPQWS